MPLQIKALLFFCFLLFPATLLAEQADSMKQGAIAFKQKNYQQALEYFLQAERNGNTDQSLQYNIAVCLYRLQRFDEAEAGFIRLGIHPKWEALAHYNLGLVAEAKGDIEIARRWYMRSAGQQRYEKLRVLSGRKLAELDRKAATSIGGSDSKKNKPSEWLSLVSLSVARDSNAATLADELVQSASNVTDTYTELLAYTQNYISGYKSDGVKLYGLLFDRRYSDYEPLNSQVFGGGLAWESPWGDNSTEFGARFTQTRVDTESLANQLQFKLSISRTVNTNLYRFSYLPSRYFASDAYRQIDGSQHRLEAEWRRQFNTMKVAMRYRYETNNREDLQRSGGFSSYSPTRYGVKIDFDWKLSAPLNAGLLLEYIRSDYPTENRLRDISGIVKQQKRETSQLRLATGLRYRFNNHWYLKGEYEYINNDDNFDLYRYDKNRISSTLEYRF